MGCRAAIIASVVDLAIVAASSSAAATGTSDCSWPAARGSSADTAAAFVAFVAIAFAVVACPEGPRTNTLLPTRRQFATNFSCFAFIFLIILLKMKKLFFISL